MALLAIKLDQDLADIRSSSCQEKIKVRFQNYTNYVVELLWIDFAGKLERYILLRKGQFIDVDTYIHHYWIARDVHTGDPMRIAKQLVYNQAELMKQHNLKLFQFPQHVRITLGITLPVYSLCYRSMLAIRDIVNSESDVEKLEIPVHLIDSIKKLISRKEVKGIKKMT